ncbi:GspH/FimT family pseudopilin [Comamonas sediminis]|uniref:GspH/FimT family pseudopilin n=1 Tax=Comamonas sediminis TaxID=1783360 RepID=UPI003D26A9FA
MIHFMKHGQWSLRRRTSGFTAVEILVMVAILAILASIAAPSFRGLIERWRARSALEDLQSTLYFARSEAIRRVGNVVVAKKGNGNGCTTADGDAQWGCGWLVFVDTDRDGSQNGTSEITLQQTSAPTRTEIEFSAAGTTVSSKISVDRWGHFSNNGAQAMTVRFRPQDSSNSDASAYTLCLRAGGQIQRLNSGTADC